ncbi:roadblock/LC7 domain-containing protein [Streptomyces albidoflavus]|uniref:roadblock/LC7 domain-containing protein n=1 Tax=Streptomyces albidoflavus TaxID=1886 RepID=UPI0033E06AB2
MTDHATLASILGDFCGETPHVLHASLVSPDGLRLASSLTEDAQADHIAAAVSGLVSVSGGGLFPQAGGGLRQVLVEHDQGMVLAMTTPQRGDRVPPVLAVFLGQGGDPGLVAHGMQRLITRLADHLPTPSRSGL